MPPFYFLPLMGAQSTFIPEAQFNALQGAAADSLTAYSGGLVPLPDAAGSERQRIAELCAGELKTLLKGVGVLGHQIHAAAQDLVVGITLGHPGLSEALKTKDANLLLSRCRPTDEELSEERRALDNAVSRAMSAFNKESPLTPETVRTLRDAREKRSQLTGRTLSFDDVQNALVSLESNLRKRLLKRLRNDTNPTPFEDFLKSLKEISEQTDKTHASTRSDSKAAQEALQAAQRRYHSLCVQIGSQGPKFKTILLQNMDLEIAILRIDIAGRRSVSPSCRDIERLEREIAALEFAKIRLRTDVSI